VEPSYTILPGGFFEQQIWIPNMAACIAHYHEQYWRGAWHDCADKVPDDCLSAVLFLPYATLVTGFTFTLIESFKEYIMNTNMAIFAAACLSASLIIAATCCQKSTEKASSASQPALIKGSTKRTPQFPIDEIFVNRWSPRAMSGQEISDGELMPLFEAARWAPSSYNGQPWRFIYAKRGTEHWEKFLNSLVPFNQEWAKNAGVLVVMISKKNFDHNNTYSPTHSFDTGAAWENLALQASLNGLVAHGIGGFDAERAAQELGVSSEYRVEAMFALGKPGNSKNLPEYMQEKEQPSDRKPVKELVFEGVFNR
jgi:nitroreductase